MCGVPTSAPARPVSRIPRVTALALLAIPLSYAGAGILLGLLPVNAGWREAEQGVTIYVSSNGVHTAIGMPVVTAEMDWRPLTPASDLRAPVAADHVFVGYGHRDFYLDTPSWAELSVATALDAAFGDGPALLHVEHVTAPRESPDVSAVTLSPDEYRRLVAFIRPRFRLDAQGRTVPLTGQGYGDHDMFYEAQGGFSLWLNCNEWTGRALRSTGIRMGMWTPTTQSVMWRLP